MLAAGLMAPVKGELQTVRDGHADVRRSGTGRAAARGICFRRRTIVQPSDDRGKTWRCRCSIITNLTPAAAAQAVQTLLELLELTPLADITPPNVSDNWRQRAALARALILKPEVLLLDNPLAGLGARHLHWWLRFLDQLSRGHEWCGGRPMTLVVTDGRFASLAECAAEICAVARQKIFPARLLERSGIGERPGRKRIAGRPG